MPEVETGHVRIRGIAVVREGDSRSDFEAVGIALTAESLQHLVHVTPLEWIPHRLGGRLDSVAGCYFL